MEELIKNGEITEQPEQLVQFRKYSDYQTIPIKDEQGGIVASISGYGLECGFDFRCVQNTESIRAMSQSIADVIMQVMVDAAVNAAKENQSK